MKPMINNLLSSAVPPASLSPQRPAAATMTTQRLAQPLHIQRLTASLDMAPLMAYAQNLLVRPLTSSDDSDSDGDVLNMSSDDIGMTKRDRRTEKQTMYNFSQVGPDRKWLQDILLSDTDSEDDEIGDEGEYVRNMLREHMKEQKTRAKYYQNANVSTKYI